MSDQTSHTTEFEPYIRPIPENDGRSKRARLLILLLLLLLLLCCCCSGSFGSEGLFQAGPQKAQFLVRNMACLQCHTELIPELGRSSVHKPFLDQECTVCHTPHGGTLTVTGSADGMSGRLGDTWFDRLLSSVFGEGSWAHRVLGTGEGSLYWKVFGPHPGSWYNRIVSWIKWAPVKFLAIIQGQRIEAVPGTSSTVTQPISGGNSYLVLPEDELCMMCHGDIGKKMNSAFPHDPVVNGQCTSCHDPHASDHGALLAVPARQLCLTCHGANMPFDAAQLHAPFENGNCLDCHDPHGSDHEGMIVRPQRELCFTCHPSVASLSGKRVQHEPFANDKCTDCHDPHGSDHAPLLLQPQPELCYSCHPAIRNEFNQPSHHPIGFGMSCGSCHDPHASDFDGLLFESPTTFCTRCHKALGERFSRSAHFDTPCTECHVAHGSQYEPMLRMSNPQLCFTCHPETDEQNAQGLRLNRHPVRPQWYDVHSGKPLTCTTTCHDPHGTEHNYLLKYMDYPYDGNCIICHQVVPGWKVGVDY